MSLSFKDNLRIRHDHLLHPLVELLICVERIEPELLSLEAVRVKGSNGIREILRGQCVDLFRDAEELLRRGEEMPMPLRAIADHASASPH